MVFVCSVAYMAGALTLAASPLALQLATSCVRQTYPAHSPPVLSVKHSKNDTDNIKLPCEMAMPTFDLSPLSRLSSVMAVLTVLKETLAADQLPTPTYETNVATSEWTCTCGPCSSSTQCVNSSNRQYVTACCCPRHSVPNVRLQTFADISLGFQTEAVG